MRVPRITTRRLMVLIAALAPILLLVRTCVDLWRGLDAHYSRGDVLDLECELALVWDAADRELEAGRPEEAERQYKQAVEFDDAISDRARVIGWRHMVDLRGRILTGLAESLAAQGRSLEAEAAHRESVRWSNDHLGEGHETTVMSLERYAAFLDAEGHTPKAKAMRDRAKAARDAERP